MKKFSIFAVLAFALASCGTKSTETDDHKMHNQNAQESAPVAMDIKTHDPVCEMVIEDTWTEQSTHGDDVIRFCSPTCKSIFDANPHKYLGDHAH